jgi:hypothetical protein
MQINILQGLITARKYLTMLCTNQPKGQTMYRSKFENVIVGAVIVFWYALAVAVILSHTLAR